jgi:hypothetical protein
MPAREQMQQNKSKNKSGVLRSTSVARRGTRRASMAITSLRDAHDGSIFAPKLVPAQGTHG